MSKITLVAQVCMFNEVEKGNLDRCLDNLKRYCDHIVIYDDASTDDSVAVAEKYGAHVIRGPWNNQMQELAHKQAVLKKSIELGATHLFWLDCDEVLDRAGTQGGLRNLCKNWPEEVDAFSFPEINLWRSQTWQRLDSLFTKARFVRLWKVTPGIHFRVFDGVHKQLYPATIHQVQEAPFGVIHYGFHDYKKMLVKIGAHQMNREALQRCAAFGIDGLGANWILDERKCACRKVPDSDFPPGCLPPDTWACPEPRSIEELGPYADLADEPPPPLIDRRARQAWTELHQNGYHGLYEKTLTRNRNVWEAQHKDPVHRHSLFHFDPAGKVIFDVGCGGGWHMLDCIVNGAEKVVGFEVAPELIRRARTSFKELGVPMGRYEFIDLSRPTPSIPAPDIVYSIAVFMHIPFWQAIRYFQWIYETLPPVGVAHLQFYQEASSGMTMFWNGIAGSLGDAVTTIRLDNELERVGFTIKSKRLAEGDGILPVWQMYECVKEAS